MNVRQMVRDERSDLAGFDDLSTRGLLACAIQALTQPTISYHLKVLREAGLIDRERRGTWVYYRLVPAALERMATALSPPAR